MMTVNYLKQIMNYGDQFISLIILVKVLHILKT